MWNVTKLDICSITDVKRDDGKSWNGGEYDVEKC